MIDSGGSFLIDGIDGIDGTVFFFAATVEIASPRTVEIALRRSAFPHVFFDSNNDSMDSCTTHSSYNSSHTSDGSNTNHTSNDRSVTPTSSPKKTKRKYTKRGSTSFYPKKGTMRANYTYEATLKPRAANTNANVAIAKSLTNTHEDSIAAVKIRQDDKRKLISLFYVQIGAPPPEDWHGEGEMISRIVGALEMTVVDSRKVETVISDTYQSLHQGEIYDKGRISRKNKTAIADSSKIQQLLTDYRECGLSYSETTFLINIYCIENDLLTVTRSAVMACEQRMEKVVTSIAKRPQGSLDKNSTWAKCRHRWVAQLLICHRS
jgi:hypothetical protein